MPAAVLAVSMLALLVGQRPALEDLLRLVPALMPTVVTPELGPAIWTLAVEPAVP